MTSSLKSEVSLTDTGDEQPEQPNTTTIGMKIQQNIGICFFITLNNEVILSFLLILKLISFHQHVRLRQCLLGVMKVAIASQVMCIIMIGKHHPPDLCFSVIEV